jgi:hypothetical protein
MPCPLPRWTRTGASVGCYPVPLGPSPLFRRVGVHDFTFEACSGFTHVTACRIAQPPKGGLCHEASARPVARSNRSSATRVYRQLPGWILPPLVNRAIGAHVESRTGAVVQAIRHHPVSRPRSSNAACGFPALRSPTGFTAKHTTRPVIARDRAADAVFALRQSSFRRFLALQVFFAGSRQSPCPRHLRKRTRSQGPSLHRRYPASTVIWPCPTPADTAACSQR